MSCWVRVQEDGSDWSPPCTVVSSDSESEDGTYGDFGGDDDENFGSVDENVADSLVKTGCLDAHGNVGGSKMEKSEEIGEESSQSKKNVDSHFENDVDGANASIPGDTVKDNNDPIRDDDSDHVNLEIGDVGLGSLGPDKIIDGDVAQNLTNLIETVGSVSGGPCNTHVIPDLNNVADSSSIGISDSVSVNSSHSLRAKRNNKGNINGVHSMKFRELIRKPIRGRKCNLKMVEEASARDDGSHLFSVREGGDESPGISLNSTSEEIEKTVKLGVDVGFQMANFRNELRDIIEGEGASNLIK
ncbi:hypothetical protein L2E82_15006 [Cichorium intybus]|uniref:Uncharacterized protein n=1 Tax=Cichorium intybus TaxID=13427 RepID=A0ACB9F1J6_CICIN|nr:hypothetical protein L2E82_15006 [Cichorium intybus]